MQERTRPPFGTEKEAFTFVQRCEAGAHQGQEPDKPTSKPPVTDTTRGIKVNLERHDCGFVV